MIAPEIPFFKGVTTGPLQTNTYIISKDSKEYIIIDVGGKAILETLDELYSPTTHFHVLLTHGHSDHVAGVPVIKEVFKNQVTTYMNEQEKPYYLDFYQWGEYYGIDISNPPIIDKWFNSETPFMLAGFRINPVHAPGHTPGSTIYYLPKYESAFVGDVIFNGSIGRTDFPHSNHKAMIQTLQKLVNTFPKQTKMYPGHYDPFFFKTQFTENIYLIQFTHKKHNANQTT